MWNLLLVLLFVVLANVGVAVSFSRAQQAFRDLGQAWVRALSGRRLGSSHSA